MSNLFYTHQEMEDVFRSKPLQYESNKNLDECVQKMKELNHFKIDVKDKKIAVVGNSGKLLKQDNAKIIDSHDIVIRCNLAITDGFEDRVGEFKKLSDDEITKLMPKINSTLNAVSKNIYKDV